MFDRIYELIRKGEVVLFCGAGMSIEAGYPSGWALAQTIFNSLTEAERSQINGELTLPDLSEAYIDLKLGKRNSLVQILKQEFSKEPKSLTLHESLMHAPQIKTIITTNYDTLFEKAYGEHAVVIRQNEDVPYMPTDKVQIIKIHGDLSLPDSVLISKSDYTRYFDTQKQELVWTLVKEKLATKNVLFAGYSLEDVNIESIITKITQQLGGNTREMFLLAPDLPELKVQSLSRKGVHYLNGKAGDFFKGLQQNIREHINADLTKGWVDAETFRKVLQLNKLNPKLRAVKEGYHVSGVEGIDRQVAGSVSFTIDQANKELIEKVQGLFKNGDLSEVVLDESNTQNLSVYINDIRFPGNEGDKLVFKPMPLASAEVDFVFNDGVEFEKISTKVYRSGNDVVFVVKLKTAELSLRLPASNLLNMSNFTSNITFKRDQDYLRPSDEIETYSFIHSLAASGGITIHGEKFGKLKFGMAVLDPMIEEAEKYLYYFKSLKVLEKYFDVRFGEINEITDKTFKVLENMLALAEDGQIISVWTEGLNCQVENAEGKEKFINELTKDREANIGYFGQQAETVELHGQELYLGYRTTRILEPYIENLERMRSDSTNQIIIKSAINEVLITFSKESS